MQQASRFLSIRGIVWLVACTVSLLALACRQPLDPDLEDDPDPEGNFVSFSLVYQPFVGLAGTDSRVTRLWARLGYDGGNDDVWFFEDFLELNGRLASLDLGVWTQEREIFGDVFALAGNMVLYSASIDMVLPASPVAQQTLELWPYPLPLQFEAGNNVSWYLETESGVLRGAGYNGSGLLALADYVERQTYTVLPMLGDEGPSRWQVFSARYDHSLFGNDSLLVFAAGANDQAQLGLGDLDSKNTPVTITKIEGANPLLSAVSLSAGQDHSLAVLNPGELWAWGQGANGRLGNDSTAVADRPVRIGTDTNWSRVSAGFGHSLGLKTDGSLWAWGLNDKGQLGQGLSGEVPDTSDRLTPVRVGNEAAWVAIATGAHSVALKNDGSLWGWGNNTHGELGNGATSAAASAVPLRVGTQQWLAISANTSNTAAIRSDGSLWTWGDNTSGQLGLGDTSSRSQPARVGTDNDWVAVSISGSAGLALKRDGQLYGWGYRPTVGQGSPDGGLIITPVLVASIAVPVWLPPSR